jgi:hypothetical protein
MLAGCATTPVGPTVRVMPGPYKPFEVFQRDQFECTQYADGQVAGGETASGAAAAAAPHTLFDFDLKGIGLLPWGRYCHG